MGPKSKAFSQTLKEQVERGSNGIRSNCSSRRVYPLVSLNPYQNSWVIKVRVTNKGLLRTFNSPKGGGNVCTMEFTDEAGSEIQATMWREAADKFYPIFQLGKVYFISNGNIKPANKQYTSVKNDYEMILNVNSKVEEVDEDPKCFIPLIQYHFVKLDSLEPFINDKRKSIDVVGIIQNVASISTIRVKSSGEEVSKRDITIFDESKKTVVLTLWGKFATEEGEKLLEMESVLAVKSLRVGDFQGVNLSTTSRSMLTIDPDIPEKDALKSWYESEGSSATLTAAGAGLARGALGTHSVYENRMTLKSIAPTMGDDKPVFFNSRVLVSHIRPDQAMYYQACEKCSRKVVDSQGSGQFWCEGCGQNFDSCKKRYIVSFRVIDSTGEVLVSSFNDQGEAILGMTADELSDLKEEDDEQRKYKAVLTNASWKYYNMRLSVEMNEYNNEKRQRIKVRSLSQVDWAGESAYLLAQIEKLKTKL